MRFVTSAFAGLIVMVALLGRANAAEPVKIGEINSYAAIPAFTVPYRNGWQLAVEEINRNGGVLGGRMLEILSRDDGGKPPIVDGKKANWKAAQWGPDIKVYNGDWVLYPGPDSDG